MVQEEIWQTILERLGAWEPEVAHDLVAKAQHTEVTRRAKDVFKALTGRWPTPLDEPYLQTARVMVEERLAESYEAAFEGLGVGMAKEEKEADALPGENPARPSEAEAAPSPAQDQGAEPTPEAEAEAPANEAKAQERPVRDKWQQAYRVVFGQDPSRDPSYRERLEKAVLLYDPAKGRRWAFEQVKEAEERLYASRRQAEEILSLVDLVPPTASGMDQDEVAVHGYGQSPYRGDLYIHIGRLTAQVEELARRLEALEKRLNREATRYGGLKDGILRLRAQVEALREGLEAKAKEKEPARPWESALRTLKGEVMAEVEERIHLATDLWRGEVEPRLKALEEWAKRITEAFRRTLNAKERNKGLFGLFGGKE
ncbi:hypothetical protein [Thermus caldifontis]|uniref:hypothetical protein n=1 Tax=Thermus caldifontis TaxID=1930763 RepID=UPI000DF3F2F8|nr:hypothetical protein [Thermus caldifontis]